jgi:hypothetical protein
MTVAPLGLAAYRFRTTLARRWTGYLTIVVLVGLVGGVAMGAIAAARRTQAAFPVFLASTNPSNLGLVTSNWQSGQPNAAGYSLAGARLVGRLPLVSHVADSENLNGQPLTRNGKQIENPPAAAALGISTLNNYGSLDGEFTRQNRATAIEGRLPDPTRADEIAIAPIVAQALNVHVGDTVPMGFYTNEQTTLPGYGTSATFHVEPYRKMVMKVVGLVDFNSVVVVDSLEVTGTANILYSPAMTRQLLACCVTNVTTYLQLVHGNHDVRRVEAEINHVAAAQALGGLFIGVQPDVSAAERAIRPESIALAVFGGIAALAALLIAGQALGRQLRLSGEERQIERALGAGRAAIVLDAVLGLLVAVVAGSVLAVAIAVALSPLAPIGIVRPVYPDRGVAFDWAVLGLGCAAYVVILSLLAVAMAVRRAPHRVSSRGARPKSISPMVRTAVNAGFPAPSVEGIRFAVDSGSGRSAVPVRSAIVGTLIAVIVVVATVTFGSSLNALVSHPNLYGWNWDYELTGGGGVAPVPGHDSARLLDRDPSVAAWSALVFGGEASIDGQLVPDIGQRPGAAVAPPVLSGHGLESSDQVVLGGETLAALHERIGDTVKVQITPLESRRLVIVGTVTMPIVGIQLGGTHPSMGTGALIPASLIPNAVSNVNNVTPYGPSAILVRARNGTNETASLAALEKIANQLTTPTNYGVSVLTVQRPAEIINYRSMGTTPAILGIGLAAGATIALGLTLVASVRRRRRDLALLKTLGFTRRQLAATVAWQASVAVGIGTVIGIPVGIVVGRSLWDAFAHQIDAVAQPFVPGLAIAAIGVGAIVLANLIATIPGRLAADTPTALLLRVE